MAARRRLRLRAVLLRSFSRWSRKAPTSVASRSFRVDVVGALCRRWRANERRSREGVSIAGDGVGARLALVHKTSVKKASRRAGKSFRLHLRSLLDERSSRRAAALSNSGTAERYQYVSVTWAWPR